MRSGKVIARFARRRPHRLPGRLARAAAALHQLPRGLPELQQLLAGHGRERLHRGYERGELLHDGVVRCRNAIVLEQLLELRRRCGAEGPQHQPSRCLPLPAATAPGKPQARRAPAGRAQVALVVFFSTNSIRGTFSRACGGLVVALSPE